MIWPLMRIGHYLFGLVILDHTNCHFKSWIVSWETKVGWVKVEIFYLCNPQLSKGRLPWESKPYQALYFNTFQPVSLHSFSYRWLWNPSIGEHLKPSGSYKRDWNNPSKSKIPSGGNTNKHTFYIISIHSNKVKNDRVFYSKIHDWFLELFKHSFLKLQSWTLNEVCMSCPSPLT